MENLKDVYSLAEFQANATSVLAEINRTGQPVFITVDSEVQAVLVDPATYLHLEQHAESDRLTSAILEGEKDIQGGRAKPASEVFAELRAKHGF